MTVSIQLHFEPSTTTSDPLPSDQMWQTAQDQLQQILDSHEECPSVGSRFLVGRLVRDIDGSLIYVDYVLTRETYYWSRHISTWSSSTPYEYDYDVFEVRPIVSL